MAKYACEQCGNPFTRDASGSRRHRFCGQPCYHTWRKEHGITAGCFQKGHVPWTKGLKGIHLSPDTEFKRGQVSATRLPIGSVRRRFRRRNSKMRAWTKVAEPNVWRPRATIVWEQAHGPIPRGCFIHHKDGNTLNDASQNLQLVTRAEHLKLHRPKWEAKRRLRASRATRRRWARHRGELVEDVAP